jgi:hypothetical protein
MIHTVTVRRVPRLGDTTTQIVGGTTQLATAGLATVQAAASAGLLTLGAAASAIPVAGAVIAVGTLIFSLLHNSRGLQQDAETTAAVNQGEALMKNNLAAWNGSNKSLATQAQALQNFDSAWQAIVNFCGQASEGSPGQRCISERQRGGLYDYYALYRDPIANDPDAGAVDRAAAAADPVGALIGQTGGTNWTSLAIPAALLVAALVIS